MCNIGQSPVVTVYLNAKKDSESNARIVAEINSEHISTTISQSVSNLPALDTVPIEMTLPLSHFPSGSYSVEFSVNNGNSHDYKIEITEAYRERKPLLDASVIQQDFSGLIFASSHASFESSLGAGLLYYTAGALVRSQVSVCIGSGGGFVPSLMRRAQLDADINPSVTILIDANLPDLAFGSPTQLGGWMTPENRFLEREDDVLVLNMLSADAAPLLAEEGIQIDHLHVDGDHSKRGVLRDWEDYAPLLSKQSVVTFHDVRMQGVASALNEILESRPELEVIRFPELGAGSALLRHRLPETVERYSLNKAAMADQGRKVSLSTDSIERTVSQSRDKFAFERWHYLESDTFRARYRLAADWVDQPNANVIEVGGFPNSIVSTLRQTRNVINIEPYAPAEFISTMKSIADDREIDLSIHKVGLGEITPEAFCPAKYNLVILGLDISSAATNATILRETLQNLFKLIDGAGRSVIEVPKYKPSLLTFEALQDVLAPEFAFDVTLDLSNDPTAIDFHVIDSRAVRRIVMFEQTRPLDLDDSAIGARLNRLVDELQEYVETVQDKPVTHPVYTPGTLVDFSAKGSSEDQVLAGFAGQETHHRWMTGETSRVSFRLDLEDKALLAHGGLVFSIQLRPFTVPPVLTSQVLSIMISGETVLTREIASEESIDVLIPPRLLFGTPLAELWLEHPDAARPCDLIDGSQDKKHLSFAVKNMTLSLADEFAGQYVERWNELIAAKLVVDPTPIS